MAAAEAIVSMPFLESLELDDVLAIRAIRDLARYGNESLLSALMDHPAISDGITDAQTTLVVAGGMLWDPDEIRRMLTPGYADIEVFNEGTELTSHLQISVVRGELPSQPGTMGMIQEAVVLAEEIMGLPLPVGHVIVLLNDKAGNKGYGGTNHGYAFNYLPEVEQRQDDYGRHNFQSSLVHEVSHYYWRDYEYFWIAEGVANIFEYIYGTENAANPAWLHNQRGGCEAFDLQALSDLDPLPGEPQFECSYYLGEELFRDLLQEMGLEEFAQGLQELHQLHIGAREREGSGPALQRYVKLSTTKPKSWKNTGRAS